MTQRQPVPADETNIPTRIEGEGFQARVFFSPLNQRIQVLEYVAPDASALVEELEEKATGVGFGKVFLKAPQCDQSRFEKAGMRAEATITGYFAGQTAVVMSSFLSEDRELQPHLEEEDSILVAVRVRPPKASVPDLPPDYRMQLAEHDDADELARLYREVFASYPFPIHSTDYIRSTIDSNVVYRIIRDHENQVVAAASAETNPTFRNAEMTDFATLPSQRGFGLAQHILAALEDDMERMGIPNLYTIARARSAGMNRVFYNFGYRWTGTLVNNCHISGQFEDMHVWCKQLVNATDYQA